MGIIVKVEIYGKSGCTFCEKAIELCKVRGIDYEYKDVGKNPDLIYEITERSGIHPKKVPQIFLNDEYIYGGFTGLYNYLNVI